MKNKHKTNLIERNKRNFYVILLLLLLAVLLIFELLIKYTKDKNPPVIRSTETEIVYTAGEDLKSLLKGIEAFDEEEGDVSDTLTVENIYPDVQSGTATVIYAARDSSNNIAKKRLVVIYNQKETDISDSDDENNPPEEKKTETKSQDKVETESQKETQKETLSKEHPRIALTRNQVSVKAGDEINRLSFVKSVSDDKDDEEYLSKRIQITGDEFDRDKPGVYKQIFYVIDSDGNKSNKETLIITIE